MATLHVERLGGLANFGGTHAHVRSHGYLETGALSDSEQQAVEVLFQSRRKAKATQPGGDAFRYKISRTTSAGTETIEVPESLVPTALVRCVNDELV